MEWIILMGFVCACCSLASFYFGYQTRPVRAAPLRSHRQVTLDVDGFCRLIRGWEWVDIDEDGAMVGVTLRGVGGTTGMRLALLQVEREIARGDRLPIRNDRIHTLVKHEPVSAATLNVHIGENMQHPGWWRTPKIYAVGDPYPGSTAAEANLAARIHDDPDAAAREGIHLGDQP